jgi:hypothetical protein
MATITLTKVREAKNGIVSFKANSKRATGTVYFDKKMFPQGAPQTLTITAEGIQEPAPEPVKEAKPAEAAAQAQAGEAAVAEAQAETVGSI